MVQYNSFDPNAELNGTTALAFIRSIQHDDIAEILEARGLAEVDPQAWYSLQRILDVLSDIASHENSTTNLVSVGIAAAQLGIDKLPPEMASATLEQVLLSYPKIYQTRHRGGDAGEIEVEKVNDDRYILKMRLPYPDDVFYGVMYGYVRHFRPANKRFTLRYDPNSTRRDEGGEITIVFVELGN